jgi:hypothetical protein
MLMTSITQRDISLDFQPRRKWPKAFPAFAWRGQLLTAFERTQSVVIDLFELRRGTLTECLVSCYPELGLSELARLSANLKTVWPETYQEIREGFFRAYDLKWCERLEETLNALSMTPLKFQEWVDNKKLGGRDLSPLLSLPNVKEFSAFLFALSDLECTRSEGVKILENGVELFLMGEPLNDLLPQQKSGSEYLRLLEKRRRPQAGTTDENWKSEVAKWPWPAHVQAQWQRFGDQAGLEIKLRATSPQDLQNKLRQMNSIGDSWHARLEQ